MAQSHARVTSDAFTAPPPPIVITMIQQLPHDWVQQLGGQDGWRATRNPILPGRGEFYGGSNHYEKYSVEPPLGDTTGESAKRCVRSLYEVLAENNPHAQWFVCKQACVHSRMQRAPC